MLKQIKKLWLILSIIFSILLLFSHWSKIIDPSFFWPASFLSLLFPLLLIINIVFAIISLFLNNLYFFIHLFVIVLTFSSFKKFFSLHFTNKEEGIKIMSFNVRLFDLYNWTKNKETRNKIFDLLKKEDADILCIQEFFYTENKNFKFSTLDTMKTFLNSKNVHAYYPFAVRAKDKMGIATFTKFPIINKGNIDFNDKSYNSCIYTDILYKNDTIRIYNVHLASIKLFQKDIKYRDNNGKVVTKFENTESIFKKLKYAFIKRAKQSKIISEHISKCKYPVILCGDFNDISSSFAYYIIAEKNKLNDAFIKKGFGFGQTYIGNYPSFRIDYILFDNNLICNAYKTINLKLSDHKAIESFLEIVKK